jgi:hypothetical protein
MLPGMAKTPESLPQPTWNVYKIAEKSVWLGTVEAPDAATAIEKAAAEFRLDIYAVHGLGIATPRLIRRCSVKGESVQCRPRFLKSSILPNVSAVRRTVARKGIRLLARRDTLWLGDLLGRAGAWTASS